MSAFLWIFLLLHGTPASTSQGLSLYENAVVNLLPQDLNMNGKNAEPEIEDPTDVDEF